MRRPLRTAPLAALALLLALAGCDAAGPEPSSVLALETASAATAAASENAALLPVSCNENGTSTGVFVPVSEDEGYYLDLETTTGTCLVTPTGDGLWRTTYRLGDDVPRPDRAVRVTGEDNPFYIINFGYSTPLACDGEPLGLGSSDDFTLTYTPGGVLTVDCRY